MRTHSPLVLDVHELLDAPRQPRRLKMAAAVPDLSSGLAKVSGDVAFDLMLEFLDGGILVQGEMSGELEASCGRCLNPIRRPFRVSGAEVYRPPGEVWEDGYVVRNDSIDLDPFARDAIALELPLNPLCRPDCAGLCSRCGTDLNEGPCECPEEIDPRWSALRDLGGLGG